jgi:hypothetical protein
MKVNERFERSHHDVLRKYSNIRIKIVTSKHNCLFVVIKATPPRRYPYFDVVVGLVWSHDPKSYAGGSVCYW